MHRRGTRVLVSGERVGVPSHCATMLNDPAAEPASRRCLASVSGPIISQSQGSRMSCFAFRHAFRLDGVSW